ncbi:MAG: hypothetical protein HYX96_04035 [Chloroflexi bacterium]|nr:hypothetical protein [Chloroflexota bacterium]
MTKIHSQLLRGLAMVAVAVLVTGPLIVPIFAAGSAPATAPAPRPAAATVIRPETGTGEQPVEVPPEYYDKALTSFSTWNYDILGIYSRFPGGWTRPEEKPDTPPSGPAAEPPPTADPGVSPDKAAPAGATDIEIEPPGEPAQAPPAPASPPATGGTLTTVNGDAPAAVHGDIAPGDGKEPGVTPENKNADGKNNEKVKSGSGDKDAGESGTIRNAGKDRERDEGDKDSPKKEKEEVRKEKDREPEERDREDPDAAAENGDQAWRDRHDDDEDDDDRDEDDGDDRDQDDDDDEEGDDDDDDRDEDDDDDGGGDDD